MLLFFISIGKFPAQYVPIGIAKIKIIFNNYLLRPSQNVPAFDFLDFSCE